MQFGNACWSLLIPSSVTQVLRRSKDDIEELYVRGEQGQWVQIGALGEFTEHVEDKTIYHKNLRRLVYVFGEVAGRPSADAIIDMQLDRQADGTQPQPAETIRPASGVYSAIPAVSAQSNTRHRIGTSYWSFDTARIVNDGLLSSPCVHGQTD